MAYNIPAGGIIEIRLNMLMYGQQLLNVAHYRNGENAIPDAESVLLATLEEMFEQDAGSVITTYENSLSNEVTFNYADAQVIYPTRYSYVRYTITSNGGVAEKPVNVNVQGSFTKRGPLAGRGYTGRMEIPGLIAAREVNGLWDGTARAQLADIATAWLQPLTLGTFVAAGKPIIYRRANPAASNPWEKATVQQTVRVARRRTVGVGQ